MGVQGRSLPLIGELRLNQGKGRISLAHGSEDWTHVVVRIGNQQMAQGELAAGGRALGRVLKMRVPGKKSEGPAFYSASSANIPKR